MARNLLNRSFEVIGLDQRIWLSQEVGGYGEDATAGLVPVAAGAAEHISGNVTFDIPRDDSAARSGRSLVTRLSGKKTVEVAWESYIIPGTPDGLGNPTLPPLHPILLSAFGDTDLSDPTKIIYKLSRLNDKTFRMLEEASHYSRLATGCVGESVTFNLAGDDKAQFTMEGFGQDVLVAGSSFLDQALTGSPVAATLVVQDLTYTSVSLDSSGNLVTIQYTAGGVAGSEAVNVIGSAISVQIETGVSTATQVKTAVDGFPAAAALVTVAVSGVGANAQGAYVPNNLSGGLGANELKVSLDNGQKFEVGAYIDTIDVADGNTYTNTAKLIVAVGAGVNKDIIQVGSALAAALFGDFVVGHAPSVYEPITSENALLGLKGSIIFAGVSGTPCEIISAEITLTNNFTKKDFLFGTSKSCGYIPDKRRSVELKVSMLLNKDNFSFFMRNKRFVHENVTITLEPQDIPAPSFTTSTGRTFKFEFPKVEFNIPPIEQPADSYVTLELEGVALADDINNTDNEMVLTIE
ncbi:MAG: hypothetical protein SGI96_21170 [Bacteroidota bacterium]|nr:hypothetical protein [Bacteroidota bacterium]